MRDSLENVWSTIAVVAALACKLPAHLEAFLSWHMQIKQMCQLHLIRNGLSWVAKASVAEPQSLSVVGDIVVIVHACLYSKLAAARIPTSHSRSGEQERATHCR